MGAIEKGGVVIMRIDAVQLALLCASHFIIFFSYDDVCGVRYRSDYDVEFEGKNLSLWCEVKFDKMKRKLVQFRFDADLRYEDGEVEIIGSVRDAARKAICFINEYLTRLLFENKFCNNFEKEKIIGIRRRRIPIILGGIKKW